MNHDRPSWWLYVCTAALLTQLAFQTYVVVAGPAPVGIRPAFMSGRMVVDFVGPGSAAEAAGLRAGDTIDNFAEIGIHALGDWQMGRAQVALGKPLAVVIERAGAQQTILLTQRQSAWSAFSRSERVSTIVFRVVIAAYLALGLLIAFRCPHDGRALIGAVFLCATTDAVTLPTGLFGAFRQLPSPVQLFAWIGWAFSMNAPGVIASFFCIFPRALVSPKRILAAVWIVGTAALGSLMYISLLGVYWPAELRNGMPVFFLPTMATAAIVYVVGGVLAGTVNYRRLQDANERRRVRLIVAGSIVSWPALALGLLLPQAVTSPRLAELFSSVPARLILALLAMVLPVSFAYAILHHRVFDVGVVIRQGVRYAAARRLLLALVPLLMLGLALDFILHRQQSVAELFATRGWVYVLLGVAAYAAHKRQKQWLEALDRRYFRERYDANALLTQTIEGLRRSSALESVAASVVSNIEAALHPKFVALLIRGADEPKYRAIATAPDGAAAPALAASNKIVGLLRVLAAPLAISENESQWIRQQIPPGESGFLAASQLDLLVPIAMGEGSQESILALGQRRSEEPYSREDRDLLGSVAASLAMVMDRRATLAGGESFHQCEQCGDCFDSDIPACPNDGSRLSPVSAPRLLAGRYYLERRVGHGGMGTVYAATDSQLRRRIAVKLIREELVKSADAAERFRREAQASAAFAHPNVVTVHDYGVTSGRRAFLVLELLEGEPLRERIQRNGRMDAGAVITMLSGVVEALETAHRHNLIHRDLKPENIFLARVGDKEIAKLLDFGLAKFVREPLVTTAETTSGVVVGTAPYWSPELLRGEMAGVASDIWALTVIAYEAFTGAYPFGSGEIAESHQQILRGEFIPVQHHLPDAPQSFQQFFAAAFAQDLLARPQSAKILLSELEQALVLRRAADVT